VKKWGAYISSSSPTYQAHQHKYPFNPFGHQAKVEAQPFTYPFKLS